MYAHIPIYRSIWGKFNNLTVKCIDSTAKQTVIGFKVCSLLSVFLESGGLLFIFELEICGTLSKEGRLSVVGDQNTGSADCMKLGIEMQDQ